MKVNSMIDTAEFLKEIERMTEETGSDYIDAIVEYCSKHNLEIETAAAIVKKSELIKSKLQQEAEILNILPKTTRLPV